MVCHGSVGSIPAHLRQFLLWTSPMKKIFFLIMLVSYMGCGKKGSPRPIEKKETPKQSQALFLPEHFLG